MYALSVHFQTFNILYFVYAISRVQLYFIVLNPKRLSGSDGLPYQSQGFLRFPCRSKNQSNLIKGSVVYTFNLTLMYTYFVCIGPFYSVFYCLKP